MSAIEPDVTPDRRIGDGYLCLELSLERMAEHPVRLLLPFGPAALVSGRLRSGGGGWALRAA
jgi:hypothetical protein